MRSSTLRERRRLYLMARLVVKRHYAQPLTLGVVAKTLAISTRQLQRVYNQFAEESFREDLQARRIAAATQLLSGSALPVGEVARLVGYRRAPHFTQVFRATHGVSPVAYRAEHRQPTPGAHAAPTLKETRNLA